MGLITDNNEKAYLKEVEGLTHWCQDNNLFLNISKTKELIVDFGKKQGRNYAPPNINGPSVERVDSFKHLGVHITEGLTWELHTDSAVRKARQRLVHLRSLRKFQIAPQILNFYSCTIKSVPMGNITAWYGNSIEQDHKELQRVVSLAEHIIGSALPCLKDIYIGGRLGLGELRISTTQKMAFSPCCGREDDTRYTRPALRGSGRASTLYPFIAQLKELTYIHSLSIPSMIICDK